LGYDKDYEGDESFFQPDGENTFTEILSAVNYLSPGAIIICIVSIAILIIWDKPALKKHKFFQFIPGPLIAVALSIILSQVFKSVSPALTIQEEHLVTLPVSKDFSDFLGLFSFPDFSQMGNTKIYITAITIALVASLESLLSIEACDKLDEFKRITPLNRELRAQGIGNFVSGLIGGLPITAVIVRSSANINAGARTKLSTVLHGIMLLTAVVFITRGLKMITF
jgi:MFS superfamily sulfate permease-like transporter